MSIYQLIAGNCETKDRTSVINEARGGYAPQIVRGPELRGLVGVPLHGNGGLDARRRLRSGRNEFHSSPVVCEFLAAVETDNIRSCDARGRRATLAALGGDWETVVLMPAAKQHVEQVEDHRDTPWSVTRAWRWPAAEGLIRKLLPIALVESTEVPSTLDSLL